LNKVGQEQLLEWLQSDGDFWLLGYVAQSCKDQILTATNTPRSSACQGLWERSGRPKPVKYSSVP